MKALAWGILFAWLASCTSGGGGSESNFVKCRATSECPGGFVCSAAGSCVSAVGTGGSAGGATLSPSSGGAPQSSSGGVNAALNGGSGNGPLIGGGGNGGASGSAAGAGAPAGGQGASAGAVTGGDAGSDLDGAAPEECFDVGAAGCGAIAAWRPAASSSGWSVYRATPIEGADGFAALITRGPLETANDFAFVTIDAKGGCGKPAAPTWTNVTRFAGASRAVSRGGTVALVGACVQRFSCGSTLFLNGREWIDPIGLPNSLDVDIANDGRVFVASAAYAGGDAATSQELVERWLSPTGQILAQRRYPMLLATDVAVLDDGSIAIAALAGSASYVLFQSAALDDVASWHPTTSRSVAVLGARGLSLAVAGVEGNTAIWTGALDTQTHMARWTRSHAVQSSQPMAVVIDASGNVATTVFGPFSRKTYMLIGETASAAGIATSEYDPSVSVNPVPPPPFGAMTVRPNGGFLFSTNFAGTYCE